MPRYQVISRRAGWWRAGRQWPLEPVVVDRDDLTAEQMQMLRDDPVLIVLPAPDLEAGGADASPAAPRAAISPGPSPDREGPGDAGERRADERLSQTLIVLAERVHDIEARLAVLEARPTAQPQRRSDAGVDAPPAPEPGGEEPADEEDADPPPAPGAGGGESTQSRHDQLVIGAAVLRPDVAEDWTSAGWPTVAALERQTGLRGVSAAERDAAWAEYAAPAPHD